MLAVDGLGRPQSRFEGEDLPGYARAHPQGGAKRSATASNVRSASRAGPLRRIAVVFDDLTVCPEAVIAADGVREFTWDTGDIVSAYNCHADPLMEERTLDAVLRSKPAAIIYSTVRTREVEVPRALYDADVPVVLVNCYSKDHAFPAVVPGDVAAAHRATELLIAAGHRRIAHITGEAWMEVSKDRLRGYREALATADLAVRSRTRARRQLAAELGLRGDTVADADGSVRRPRSSAATTAWRSAATRRSRNSGSRIPGRRLGGRLRRRRDREPPDAEADDAELSPPPDGRLGRRARACRRDTTGRTPTASSRSSANLSSASPWVLTASPGRLGKARKCGRQRSASLRVARPLVLRADVCFWRKADPKQHKQLSGGPFGAGGETGVVGVSTW